MNLLKRIIPSLNIENTDHKVLLENVKVGDKEAYDKMILGHTRLAVSIVNSYVKKHRVIFLVDELDGAAFEGIVVAVDRICKGHLSHDNFTGYIIYYIHEYIRKLLNKHFRMRFQQQEELSEKSSAYQSYLISQSGVPHDDLRIVDLWDQLSKITKTDFDKKVIELRSQKYTDREIAVKLNVPETTVARTRHKLKKRLANERMARRL